MLLTIAIVFGVIALVAALLGVRPVAFIAADIARIALVIFAVIFGVLLVLALA